ncbi:MAG: hypothetical protein EOO10_05470, partial [Chitinophagaceae bacterium]
MKWFRNNSLSIVFFLFFLLSIVGQSITGLKEYNNEMKEEGGQEVSMRQYFSSGHFIEATFENWESEFLQMALYVVLTMFLFQKGSSESKDPDKKEEEVDREPDPKKKHSPWPVKKGGLILTLYKHSLSIALFLLFFVSFFAHLYGSLKDYNHHQLLKGLPTETASEFIGDSKFWFESFQN